VLHCVTKRLGSPAYSLFAVPQRFWAFADLLSGPLSVAQLSTVSSQTSLISTRSKLFLGHEVSDLLLAADLLNVKLFLSWG